MRVCAKCGYVEPIEWKPTTWKSAQYIDCCRVSDLEKIEPLLLERLLKQKEVVEGFYAYKISKTGIWVLRRWVEIWKIQGWKEIPAEQHIKPKLPLNQRLLLEDIQNRKEPH